MHHIVPTRILFLCRKRSRLLDFLRLLLLARAELGDHKKQLPVSLLQANRLNQDVDSQYSTDQMGTEIGLSLYHDRTGW